MPTLPLLTEKFPGGPGIPGAGGQVTNFDDGTRIENNATLPWCIDPAVSYMYYDCSIVILLDPGSVLHKPLPQTNRDWDSLGSIDIDSIDFFKDANGVNLDSNSKAVDVIQRMASSTYRFALVGEGYRAGYQVSVPNLRSIGGSDAVPTDPHRVAPRLTGSLMGGIPLWYCQWELHYLVAVAPRMQRGSRVAVANPAAAIRPDAELPAGVFVPVGPADQRATNERISVGNFVRSAT